MAPYLPDNEPRCRPWPHCERSAICGRAQAELPAFGASIINGMANGKGTCLDYIALSDCVPPVAPARPVHLAW